MVVIGKELSNSLGLPMFAARALVLRDDLGWIINHL